MIYRLRKEARWHDGKPVTPEDVIFSLETLKKLSPFYAAYYRHVVKAEKTGERDVKFTFDSPGNRELPTIVGQLTVLPKHWWEGTDEQGSKRDISATTLEPPLGSGAYRIKDFVAGRSVVLERVKDYWGANLPVRIGQNNFDEMRFEYFRDNTVALEAFKADQVDWIAENSAKHWATAYEFPAVVDKRVLKEEFPIRFRRHAGLRLQHAARAVQGRAVRRAFNYAFDFEEMNKQLFYGQYKRINSYFEGTELACSGLPQGMELQILETVRTRCRRKSSRQPYTNPVGGNPENVRNNLREATKLLKEAGFEVRDRKLVDSSGRPVTVEFLVQDPAAERMALFYKPSLERLGITTSIRIVDDAQYENRIRSFDFDIITEVWGAVAVARQRAARLLGLAGGRRARLAQPDRHQESGDRCADRAGDLRQGPAELVAATRALDRVLLWNHYVVPQFTYGFARMRAGTASATRTCRNTAARASRRCGGTTPRRPRRSASAREGSFAHGALSPAGTFSASVRARWRRFGCRRRMPRTKRRQPRCTACRRSAT